MLGRKGWISYEQVNIRVCHIIKPTGFLLEKSADETAHYTTAESWFSSPWQRTSRNLQKNPLFSAIRTASIGNWIFRVRRVVCHTDFIKAGAGVLARTRHTRVTSFDCDVFVSWHNWPGVNANCIFWWAAASLRSARLCLPEREGIDVLSWVTACTKPFSPAPCTPTAQMCLLCLCTRHYRAALAGSKAIIQRGNECDAL